MTALRSLALRSLLAGGLLLAGCTLIDQRTFDPNAGKLVTVAPAPGPQAAPPLVTVDFARPNPAYAVPLHQAVTEALDRKPDVRFDVVTIVPATGTIAQQASAASALTPDAREIARRINADGADDDRIHLSAQSDPAATSRQVRVFVH